MVALDTFSDERKPGSQRARPLREHLLATRISLLPICFFFCNYFYLSSQEKCFPCGHTECPLMGHHADKIPVTNDTTKTKYFLTTGSTSPFRRKYADLPGDFRR